ncbi:hypothetical protein ACSS6W_003691 [Trichoderma asperelloides]
MASIELTATILRVAKLPDLKPCSRILPLEFWAVHKNLIVSLYFAGDVGSASRNLLFGGSQPWLSSPASRFNYGGSEDRIGS